MAFGQSASAHQHNICQRHGNKNCGEVTAETLCGEVQTLSCGACFGSDLCGGSGVPNVCSECKPAASVAKDCTDGWCKIPAGCFWMGSATDSYCQPFFHKECGKEFRHQVALTHSFAIMEAEVRQSEFKAVMGYSAAKNRNHKVPLPADLPMDYVTWHEAAQYANALSASKWLDPYYACKGSGRFVNCGPGEAYTGSSIYGCPGFRLPTEAEWEYALRAGTETELYNGSMTGCDCEEKPDPAPLPKYPQLDEIAWWGGNANANHNPVKQMRPNAWGLYDMIGNVWEWNHDVFQDDLGSKGVVNPTGAASGTNRVVRGGGWIWPEPRFFHASVRRKDVSEHNCEDLGFRLASTLGPGPLK